MGKSTPSAEDEPFCSPLPEDLLNDAYAGHASASLVGDVIETRALCHARALVRWRTSNGVLREERLAVLKGLNVEKGDLVLLQRPANWPEWLVTGVIEGAKEATADKPDSGGRQIAIEAADEVVLRCGEASITLRRNGRVVIRGNYVETRSRGTNRIKGGVVLIN